MRYPKPVLSGFLVILYSLASVVVFSLFSQNATVEDSTFPNESVIPTYPVLARRDGLEGTVQSEVEINNEGRVERVLNISGSDHSGLYPRSPNMRLNSSTL